MFLISIKGKFNILVKISDLQNCISYQKPDFMKFHGRYSKSFFFYEILPFYKVIVVTCVDTKIFTVNRLTPYILVFFVAHTQFSNL